MKVYFKILWHLNIILVARRKRVLVENKTAEPFRNTVPVFRSVKIFVRNSLKFI
jgi:hypothetical protein